MFGLGSIGSKRVNSRPFEIRPTVAQYIVQGKRLRLVVNAGILGVSLVLSLGTVAADI